MVMESLERLEPPLRMGKLTLLAQLGEGGMATVYVASVGRGSLARLAAVKLLRHGVAEHDYRTRFLDEAKVVVRLHHNNIVDVREAGEVGDRLYIAMELIEGRDLADIWDRCAKVGRAFPVPLAIYMVREILRGLHYAHTFPGLALVHRDISPSNILVDWAGAVRLADFGLATSAMKASLTVPGLVFGKVGYMAPEQATREDLDARADVYGCGVVLWELLTGRPFRDGDVDTKQVAVWQPRSPKALSKRVDDELESIVMKAIALDPDARYLSAEAFMKVLSAWLSAHAPQTNQETVAEFMTLLFGDSRTRDHEVYTSLLDRLPHTGIWDRRARQRATADLQPPQDGDEIPNGTVLVDRYKIEHELGQGGMGIVYLAEHLTVGRKVAVKVLTHEWSRHEVVAKRFKEEARAASAAGHPNIVEVFDAGKLPDGRLYIAMEYLTGHSLYHEVVERGSLDVLRTCRIIREVARAVAAAHEVGIIHRDLKPDNVMLMDRGDTEVVKVLDFGISASAVRSAEEQRLTRPGHALGTPEYMAPEQAVGAEPSPLFDIYALGIVMYEMLTGFPPIVSDNLVEVLTRKATEDPRPVRELRPDIPRALGTLVDRCCSRDPAQRPQTVVEFLETLGPIGDALAQGLPLDGMASLSFERALDAVAAESRAFASAEHPRVRDFRTPEVVDRTVVAPSPVARPRAADFEPRPDRPDRPDEPDRPDKVDRTVVAAVPRIAVGAPGVVDPTAVASTRPAVPARATRPSPAAPARPPQPTPAGRGSARSHRLAIAAAAAVALAAVLGVGIAAVVRAPATVPVEDARAAVVPASTMTPVAEERLEADAPAMPSNVATAMRSVAEAETPPPRDPPVLDDAAPPEPSADPEPPGTPSPTKRPRTSALSTLPPPPATIPETAPPARAKPKTAQECARERGQADLAYQFARWDEVLANTRTASCWEAFGRQRTLMMVRALLGTAQWRRCVAAGRGSSDPKVREFVAACQAKLDP